jgi:hypothetical protein
LETSNSGISTPKTKIESRKYAHKPYVILSERQVLNPPQSSSTLQQSSPKGKVTRRKKSPTFFIQRESSHQSPNNCNERSIFSLPRATITLYIRTVRLKASLTLIFVFNPLSSAENALLPVHYQDLGSGLPINDIPHRFILRTVVVQEFNGLLELI